MPSNLFVKPSFAGTQKSIINCRKVSQHASFIPDCFTAQSSIVFYEKISIAENCLCIKRLFKYSVQLPFFLIRAVQAPLSLLGRIVFLSFLRRFTILYAINRLAFPIVFFTLKFP